MISEAERTLAEDEAVLARSLATIDSLEGGITGSDSVMIQRFYAVSTGRVLRANMDGYRDLVSSGGVTLIRDAEVRRLLSRALFNLELASTSNAWNVDRVMLELTGILETAAADSPDLSRRLILNARVANQSRRFHMARKSEARESALEARAAIASWLEG